MHTHTQARKHAHIHKCPRTQTYTHTQELNDCKDNRRRIEKNFSCIKAESMNSSGKLQSSELKKYYLYLHVYSHTCADINTLLQTFICRYTCTCTNVHLRSNDPGWIPVCMHQSVYVYIYVLNNISMVHVNTYIYEYTCTYTHI